MTVSYSYSRLRPKAPMLASHLTTQPQQPRPLFLYGTFQALPLLAWAMTGDPAKVDVVEPLVQPARIRGSQYARFALHGRDYPAVVKIDIEHADASASTRVHVVDGLLFRPQNRSQRKKMDDFEGETYQAVQVDVEVAGTVDSEGVDSEIVRADLYVWNGAPDDVSEEEWDLDVFVRERLDDWLELFVGMELVGDDEA
ncbi:hypothetical protein V8D89_009329 [Ganoderma adspersum]